ncbi:MAG: methylenetetrahydrofolate reductase C-terminal domain-containing protein [Planctomycetota bacterium]
MNATNKKPLEEILTSLEGDKRVFVLGCSGCPEGLQTGSPKQVAEMAGALKEKGVAVTGTTSIDFLCNKALVGIKLQRRSALLKGSDCILVMSCGVGVSAVGNMVPGKRVAPALNTISVGGMQGIWPSSERCGACGECYLAYTGGLCPITTCTKSLLNGTCGGTGSKGNCEINAEKPCGWLKIYERLKEIGRLDLYARCARPRDFGKLEIAVPLRRTSLWALELDEEKAEREYKAKTTKKKKKKKKKAKKAESAQ